MERSAADTVTTQADMEEYLRRVQSRLGADALEGPVHAVLGGPEPDVDTVAATLCLALHLNQKETSGGVCVPVLCGQRCDDALPRETVRYLQRVKICERSLLWREDVDLVKLQRTGKLSLTVLRDGLLDSSEYRTLESCILRVVHHDGQQDAGDDGASSTLTTVAREILQEAAEHIGAALGETLGEALRLQSEALWSKHGCRSAQLEELLRSLEQWSDVTVSQHDEAKLQDLEQLLTMELKEFSDGEMTIALASVNTDKEDWHSYVDGLKLFSVHHGYDGVVVLLSINDTLHHPRHQVAVYSNNTDMLNQICCELEESSTWSLSGELEARENLQLYNIPLNTSLSSGTPLLVEEIQGLLKDFVYRRSSVLACHPSSRTSSTEGVAGSVEFSQGSSGINDMDGSDIERAEGGSGDVVTIARVMADGEEDTGGVGVGGGGELVSPDSGMTTIRSSRSSKESSVFLSDDSPVVKRQNEKAEKRFIQSENQRGKSLEPQLSLITEQTESYDNWNQDYVLKDQWNPVTMAYLQLTPPEEETQSKEEDEGAQGKKGDRQKELLDFWTYSAQKGFLKSDSGTTTSYPESLDMWNMTIRDDSLSPLTTPDNLSETSGSFCGVNPNVRAGTSVESPPGFSDGGMVMWNTTIQEDSSSTITSPEGPDNGKDLSHMGSLDASDSPETHASKKVEEDRVLEEDRGIYKVLSQDIEEVGWRGTEHNVKIVIEVAESKTQDEETGDIDIEGVQNQQSVLQNLASEHSEAGTSSYHDTDMWDLPVPGMVTSTSEYDNVGADTWSRTSSPETYSSPVVDMIQLEEQSSPFVAVKNPVQHDQYQDDPLGKIEYSAVFSDKEQPANQVFLFKGTSELDRMTGSGGSSVESKYDNKSGGGSEEADWLEQPGDHSPFVLVDYSTVTQDPSANHRSSLREDVECQIQTDQPLSPSLLNWGNLVSEKHDGSESMSSSHDLSITVAQQ
ncbi:Protein prune-like protein 2 BNIP2 motif-containing molecule at the C-terminal region 1 [Larimichthys crocea]|uniref:Protein prune-like protein 2 BNIP2 motif-containing molecule at the C-terminal region 1 n=1 Tax=Larimichthys crocea TaxID=215358 RepID=A0A6G0IL33_LARCR|nr:Protein prune-like protein 2 BNIP2 motif-containing molecule at the C-terminal region 1 [Larimichthys crocea]